MHLASIKKGRRGRFFDNPGLLAGRSDFVCLVPVALITLAWQWLTLPSMRVEKRAAGAGNAFKVFTLFKRRGVAVGWWAWVAKTFPNDAEAAGGLLVAVVQMAIALGSTVGGLLFDHSGYQSTFVASAALLLISTILIFIMSRMETARPALSYRQRWRIET